jgi:benzil reductase ((S)-benzoin forming)
MAALRSLAAAPMNLYIVTGTTRGLGAALAARIAADRGNELVALSRGDEGAIAGGHLVRADLASSRELAAACERAEALFRGKAYEKAVLVNNAGVIAPVGPLDEVDAAELERSLAVNLVAPMLLMRWFIRATGGVPLRRIINISSGAGRRPIFGWSAYCAAKAALDMASRTVELECETRALAVDVVSLAPGVVDTAMQEAVRSVPVERFMDVERFRAMKAEGMLRSADDVAADILRLEQAGALKGEAVQDLRQIA